MNITISIDPGSLADLRRMATNGGFTISAYIRYLLWQEMQHYGQLDDKDEKARAIKIEKATMDLI